jgi:dUTP pyrophosphatase
MAASVIQIPMSTLKLYIEDPELKKVYLKHVVEHNNKVIGNPHPDSGFDILIPNDISNIQNSSQFVNFKIKCDMTFNEFPTAFFLYCRSSAYKNYNIMICNSTGIIDSGYRGYIGGYFYTTADASNKKCLSDIKKYSKITQICSPNLSPIIVKIVDNENDLTNTSRGTSGFGSTGK